MKYIKKTAKKYEPGFCAACGGSCDNRCKAQCVVVQAQSIVRMVHIEVFNCSETKV